MFHRTCILLSVLVFVFQTVARASEDRLVVHEWGTFTCLQNEWGRELQAINTDDEPVPAFVHRLPQSNLVYRPVDLPPYQESKGAAWAEPGVTMRLETPVIYFHPPASAPEATVDVEVQFRDGWLTEFYPNASCWIGREDARTPDLSVMQDGALGRLAWKGLHIGGVAQGPPTSEHVWQAPRQVEAATVRSDAESEKYLFYRGIAALEAPIQVLRDEKTGEVAIMQRPARSRGVLDWKTLKMVQMPDSTVVLPEGQEIKSAWLVDVRPDGRSAFRELPPFRLGSPDHPSCKTAGAFPDDAYAPDNLAALKKRMHAAIVREGLFADEADALLNTWELSYFKSPGERLFFLLPRFWTDHVLPLRLSVPADLTRVMVGRIELVTPRQRELLAKMAGVAKLPDLRSVISAMHRMAGNRERVDQYRALASGRGDPRDLGVPVPEVYRWYLELGRFRAPLVLAQGRTLGRFARMLVNGGTPEAQPTTEPSVAQALVK